MNVESRIARFESDLGHIKKDVAQIAEIVGKLQEGQGELVKEVSRSREEIGGIKAVLPHFATKADLKDLESRVIRWFIFTSLGAISLAFTIAKVVN